MLALLGDDRDGRDALRARFLASVAEAAVTGAARPGLTASGRADRASSLERVDGSRPKKCVAVHTAITEA